MKRGASSISHHVKQHVCMYVCIYILMYCVRTSVPATARGLQLQIEAALNCCSHYYSRDLAMFLADPRGVRARLAAAGAAGLIFD